MSFQSRGQMALAGAGVVCLTSVGLYMAREAYLNQSTPEEKPAVDVEAIAEREDTEEMKQAMKDLQGKVASLEKEKNALAKENDRLIKEKAPEVMASPRPVTKGDYLGEESSPVNSTLTSDDSSDGTPAPAAPENDDDDDDDDNTVNSRMSFRNLFKRGSSRHQRKAEKAMKSVEGHVAVPITKKEDIPSPSRHAKKASKAMKAVEKHTAEPMTSSKKNNVAAVNPEDTHKLIQSVKQKSFRKSAGKNAIPSY